ncbi:40S ribosomal protein S15 [Podarcis lilfordi]|uniref:40S ribosomal protein S15 n=1 Tax=Podarcis lilfordi TaxID=74358 RepID=A0AA35KR51_9SAUR|nr:40S ribosomal protein S15 [Podarcis lilfordi]
MAEVEQTKKHTFRKFTYRGVDLDQLLDMSYEQLMQLYSACQRQQLNRGLHRKQHFLLKWLCKAKKEALPMEKPEVVKTHLRHQKWWAAWLACTMGRPSTRWKSSLK